MMLNCDKYFIEALQEAGYDIDYKRLIELYKQSRENPAYLRRRTRRLQEEHMIDKMFAVDDGSKVLLSDLSDKCSCEGQMYHAKMVWDGNDYVWTTPPELYTDGGVTP